MDFNTLFEKRKIVAQKLKQCLLEKGYTKVAFCKKIDVSRPTLDKLLNAEITNKASFDKHMQKILATLNLSADELLNTQESAPAINAVYSQNAPSDYSMSSKAQKQYELLLDVLDLCEIYY